MIRGYVTSRPFAGLSVPVPAQNSCLREYARSLGQSYALPPLEHKFDNCYMQLYTVINSASPGDIIAMYSISMLPLNDLPKLIALRHLALCNTLTYSFLLEACSSTDLFDLASIMQSYSLRSVLDNNPPGPSLLTLRSLISN